MNIEALAPLSEFHGVVQLQANVPTGVSQSTFGQWFTKEITAVNGQLLETDRNIQQLAVGETSNLHETMIRMEETRLSFQLLVQVRNRLLEAYQEVMRMQV